MTSHSCLKGAFESVISLIWLCKITQNRFDDIGCALIWLQQQPWKDNARSEIWVADHCNGNWLDARSAYYLKDRISPMNYGLGAIPEMTEGALNFTQAKVHIMTVDKARGGHNRSHAGVPQ